MDVPRAGGPAGRADLGQRVADEHFEAFVDRGEHNYGLWEYSYYGTPGALDNRGANNRPLPGLSGPEVGSGDPSGRAPFYVTSRKYGVYADTLANSRAMVAVNGRTSNPMSLETRDSRSPGMSTTGRASMWRSGTAIRARRLPGCPIR